MTSLDEAVAILASNQHGSFTRRQVLAAGGSRQEVEYRLRTRMWLRRGDGLYVLASAVPGWRLELRTGLLKHGPLAVVSHRAAAALHGWPSFHVGLVELTSPGAPNYRSFATIHRTRDVVAEDVTVVDGFPVTTPVRTALDMASLLRRRRLEWLIDDLLAAQAFTGDELHRLFLRVARRGKPGMGNVRFVLESRGPGYVAPASRLERLLLDVLLDAGLPEPVRQHPLPSRAGPGRVDFAYPEYRLLIEADSRRWHTRSADFETDRQRDNEATAVGWAILRFTWLQLTESPGWVGRIVRESLRQAA